MPLRACHENGKPGYSWGNAKCYTYTPGNENSRKDAKEKAKKQGRAIERQKHMEGKSSEESPVDLLNLHIKEEE